MRHLFEDIVFKYLDNKNFIVEGKDESCIVAFYDSPSFYPVSYPSICEWCGMTTVSKQLNEELCTFFSISEEVCEELVIKWVENKLKP